MNGYTRISSVVGPPLQGPGFQMGHQWNTTIVHTRDFIRNYGEEIATQGPDNYVRWLANHVTEGYQCQWNTGLNSMSALHALQVSLRPIYGRLDDGRPPTFERLTQIQNSRDYKILAITQFCMLHNMEPPAVDDQSRSYKWIYARARAQSSDFGHVSKVDADWESLFDPEKLKWDAIIIMTYLLCRLDDVSIALGRITKDHTQFNQYKVHVDAAHTQHPGHAEFSDIAWFYNDSDGTTGEKFTSRWAGLEPTPRDNDDPVTDDTFVPRTRRRSSEYAMRGGISITEGDHVYRWASSKSSKSGHADPVDAERVQPVAIPQETLEQLSTTYERKQRDDASPDYRSSPRTPRYATTTFRPASVPALVPASMLTHGTYTVPKPPAIPHNPSILFEDVQSGIIPPWSQEELAKIYVEDHLLLGNHYDIEAERRRQIQNRDHNITRALPYYVDLPWREMLDNGIQIEELIMYFPNHALRWPGLAFAVRDTNWHYLYHCVAGLINIVRGDHNGVMDFQEAKPMQCFLRIQQAIKEILYHPKPYRSREHDWWRLRISDKWAEDNLRVKPHALQEGGISGTVSIVQAVWDVRCPQFLERNWPFTNYVRRAVTEHNEQVALSLQNARLVIDIKVDRQTGVVTRAEAQRRQRARSDVTMLDVFDAAPGECRKGVACRRFNCKYLHPQGWQPPQQNDNQNQGQQQQQGQGNGRQVCRWKRQCTNPSCKHAHPGPAAPPDAVVNTSQECKFGNSCTQSRCNRSHSSAAAGSRGNQGGGRNNGPQQGNAPQRNGQGHGQGNGQGGRRHKRKRH
ncbi:hypothetical protein M011DRAFT_458293 [Sporormia fimetaria CBS 119925]|uniref:C3H1-type domain-containing protein n=1 Tax=Sporormia fimetaria CBS 119925 TaxID=1340428 RepID=A0A6A6VEB5_9PLEO|nr:hypothetical protein M011DRAFT_458293 [Sporormia fimetaria CBS 119925]